MARTRQIKPEAFDDPDLNTLPALTRWFFAGLWTQADKKGRLEDDPRRLRVRLLPFDADADADAMLEQLRAANMVRRYTGDDQKHYLQIVNFLKHQNPHPNEQDSKIPEENHQGRVIKRRVRDKDGTCRVITPESGSLYQSSSSSSGGTALSGADAPCLNTPAELLDVWNEGVEGTDLPKAEVLSASRTRAIRSATQEHPERQWWASYVARIIASDFLMARIPRDAAHANWRPDLDWALRPVTMAKVLEGKYDNRNGPPGLSAKGQRNLTHAQTYLREVGQA